MKYQNTNPAPTQWYTTLMDSRRAIYFGMFVGGLVGGYIPALWGDSLFSFASIIGNAVGALFGIWVMFRLTR